MGSLGAGHYFTGRGARGWAMTEMIRLVPPKITIGRMKKEVRFLYELPQRDLV
jgi:hypothetical protein